MKVYYFLIFFLLLGCADSKEMRLQKFLLKGNMALKGQYTDEAEKYFNEALLIDPCYADALNNLGTMRFDTQHYDEAVTFYTKAIDCRPGFLAPVFNRANAYLELKEYYSAEKDADYLVKHKPMIKVAQ
jgi:tetratricopeptide (TPR) repeat protein